MAINVVADSTRAARLLRRPGRTSHESERDRLILENVPFAISIAAKYRGPVPFDDLVAAGILGLVEAADRFDPNRGVRFITYAVHWVRREILRACRDGDGQVNVPPRARRCGVRLPPVVRLDDDRDSFGEYVAKLLEDHSAGPESLAEASSDAAFVRSLVRKLPPRARLAVTLHYGIGRSEPMTIQQVGNILGLSRERVRQLVLESLTRLLKSNTLVSGGSRERKSSAKARASAKAPAR